MAATELLDLGKLRAFRERHNGASPAVTSAVPQTASCIDVSHWQGFPDFEKAHASGVIACIMKATEGTSYVDPNRAKNFVNATRAGIKCACYFWLKPGDGADQARFFLDTIDPVPGERVVIDYEEDGCTIAGLHEAVRELIAHDPLLQITVYSGHLLKEQLGHTRDEWLAKTTDLWLAQYTSDVDAITWPKETYPEWSLHQYSQNGTIPGVAGACDLDRFNGSNAALLYWMTPRTRLPEPEPDGVVVTVTIDAPPGITVNVVRTTS